ncbi:MULTISPECIES: CRISPR-associated protein Cas4 [Methanosarcina]|uniref:CRISPR-associated exonuclease Cas4 n=1 Tax=Methanosarcina vacuolata Z-761 TaxID=1434123 RepID=A0A0E3Q2R7_9EURY|nr:MULTISPECIES: CRISPR-associated protein Cas4 [Methanosarcina]AKB42875.1 CRISPR-associated RecB family exonuclease Cas4b [Methanosarcina vacuolata Z-761]AKB46364.1 CRISPR-associated RecB family exonuclease Cas4b [Methanosarcina sp. Kolksee]
MTNFALKEGSSSECAVIEQRAETGCEKDITPKNDPENDPENDPDNEEGTYIEPNSENDSGSIIRISDVLEYLFCSRFIYYMYCLDIPQHEEKRFKVIKGREVHETRKLTNRDYVRKKLNCMRKDSDVFIASKQHHIKGIVDEVLFLEDGTAAPLEYKFAEYKDKIFKTYKFQLVLQALLIRENYSIEVNRAYICFTRSNSLVKEMEITTSDFKKAEKIIEEILDIVQKGLYPKTTISSRKCVDCCYRNICV